MANTLNSLFPFSTLNQKGVTVKPCAVIFEAPIINGYYVFDNVQTPAQEFDKVLQDQCGVIAGVMISANCMPDDFAQNVENFLQIQVLHGGNDTPVNVGKFPFATFQDGGNFQLISEITSATTNNEDIFKLSVSGRVAQINNMSENVLRLKIAFNFFRVPKKDIL